VKSKFRNPLKSGLCVAILGVCAVCGVTARAQTNPQSKPDRRNRLQHLPDLQRRLGRNVLPRLSSGGANMFHIAKVLSDPAVLRGPQSLQGRAALEKALAAAHSRVQAVPSNEAEQATEGHTFVPVLVNDAALDYEFTRFSGFTQSETSSAWCGDHVVVGFNDSGAFVRSVVENVGGASFTNAAVSHDRGRNFVGLPFLNPSSDPAVFLGGDPVVVCSDAQHFAYASLFSQVDVDSQGNVTQALSGISVSRSSNGGTVWENPILAVTKDANFHFLDKEWMTVDPHNPRNLYITYTDFGAFGSDLECNDSTTPGIPGGPDVRLEIVSSKDGGNSWSEPVLLDRKCNLGLEQNLSGTQVVVGPRGEVYVAYAAIDQKSVEERIRRSDDGGATFAPAVVVGEATTASSLGDFNLQGNFRTNAFPMMAVDGSIKATRGTLYIVWTDATRNQIPDLYANFIFGDPVYSFGEVVLSVSRDGGSTWSAPKRVSPTPADFRGAGRDQFMGGVAVDAGGDLAVCYSDRRNDPNNFAIDHYCSISRNQGGSFEDIRETPFSWTPSHNMDVFINPDYMGDYDAVSSDNTGSRAGFFSSFQIQTNTNPDVYGMRLKP
jgi:hypothetical protein